MKTIRVVAAVIRDENRIFATQRGYGDYKDGWEFPGGKIEPGETSEQALVREIKEELETFVQVEDLIKTIEYDYPEFHLSMDCYWCRITGGDLVLREHESSKWLSYAELDSVDWLPADRILIEAIRIQWKAVFGTERKEKHE
ncbi:MAG: 8-oxo-dGTP diphosphatase MutT [Lachnospiraceae bacterium]|nr:8-oxo-dGTP diphosphatase MutT [Lachnospiraceae bacterium]